MGIGVNPLPICDTLYFILGRADAGGKSMANYLDSLSREDLMKYVQLLSKNFLTLDGYWFLGVEDRYGLDKAVELDSEAWGRYGVSEARRIKSFLGIAEGGPEDLEKALQLICFAPAQRLQVEVKNETVRMEVRSCRPQSARLKSGRGEFPCKPVGIAHLSAFAKEINPRFRMTCVHCPPDSHPEGVWCCWEFKLD
jgi:hypothetical protein